MPRPFASAVLLSSEQRDTLTALVRARSTPQAMVFRCRIILAAAQPEHPTNQQVADALDCNRHTVGQWRERYVTHGLTGLQDAPRSGRPRSFPPAERLQVVTLASSKTEDHRQPDTSWSLDNIAFEILRDAHHRSMSRSTVGRILAEADLKPHRSVYWLNSHDPDFDAKAKDICQLYLNAPRLHDEGRLVLSSDEKTGMQILQRKYPTRLARPGSVEKREFEYIRHGTRALLTTFCVPTGRVVWNLGPTRTSIDWVRHLDHVAAQFPLMKRFDWVVDNLNTHWSPEVGQWVAQRSGIPFVARAWPTGRERRTFLADPSHKHVFHFTPIHGSWLNQVELFFSVLSRRFLKRGDFADAADFEERIRTWLTTYNREHAHPYRWTYTGEPLVRATPFSQTRRQQQRGRAWVGVRPPLWERELYPPRPYRRKSKTVAANL